MGIGDWGFGVLGCGGWGGGPHTQPHTPPTTTPPPTKKKKKKI